MNTRHVNTQIFLATLLCLLAAMQHAFAQGFFRQYPLDTYWQGGAQSVFPKANGDFRLTAISYPDFDVDLDLLWLHTDAQGHLTQADTLHTPPISYAYHDALYLEENGGYIEALGDSNAVVLQRFDPDGSLLWSARVDMPGWKEAVPLAARPNAAGDIFLRGYRWGSDPIAGYEGFLLKFSASGDLIWQTSYDFELTFVIPTALLTTPDGGGLFVNYSSTPPNAEEIVRFDAAGHLAWQYVPPKARLYPAFDGPVLGMNADGEALVFSQETVDPSGPNPLRLDKLDAAGNLTDSLNLSALTGLGQINGQLLLPLADGGTLVVVEKYLLNSWTNYAARIWADGSLAWLSPLNLLTDAFPASLADAAELTDGNLVLYGYQGSQLFLIKMSAGGIVYPHTLTGRIARDSTFNCLPEASDPPLQGWIVRATGNGPSRYAASDGNGQYTISNLDTGAYQIVLTPPSYLWEPCDDSLQVQFSGSIPVTDTLDFPVQALYDCPLMQVDIAVPFLRRCMENTYSVWYCNAGNQAASDAVITVLLDPLLEIDSASVNYTQNGQLLTVQLGDVPAGACGAFRLYATASCAAVLGQTLCVEAHIYPDTLCAPNLPNWSGARVEVSAQCNGDSVLFFIRNTGSAAMPHSLDFIIVDDHVITRQGSFQLPAGGLQEEAVPADGSTWRLIASQEPGFPFGPQMPSTGIEACLPNPGGAFSTGMLNMFANFTGNPFDDTDCHPVVGSFDPNDKQALPTGADDGHYIVQNQPIDYLIRFQNTGTDTAFTVVLRDTLSAFLNPTTIRPGAASHPYTWQLSGEGILTVVFDHILLPDSNVNERASHGFFQFRIDQQRDNPPGSVIENRAGIYFDFNAPVMTNTVFHTVGNDFLLTAAPEPARGPGLLHLWPNPATQRVLVVLDEWRQPGCRLVLRDGMGRPVRQWAAQYLRQEIRREGLPAGVYWLELRAGQRLVAVGKVVWVD